MDDINFLINEFKKNYNILFFEKIIEEYDNYLKKQNNIKRVKLDKYEYFSYYLYIEIQYKNLNDVEYLDLINRTILLYINDLANNIKQLDYNKYLFEISFLIYSNELKNNNQLLNFFEKIYKKLKKITKSEVILKTNHNIDLLHFVDGFLLNYTKNNTIAIDFINFLDFFNISNYNSLKFLKKLNIIYFMDFIKYEKYLKLIINSESFNKMIKYVKKIYKVN